MGLYDQGFVIRVPGGAYIEKIVTGRLTEKTHAYAVADIEHAKIWYQPAAVRKARSRAGLGGRILMVRRDGNGRRVIVGQLGKETDDHGDG